MSRPISERLILKGKTIRIPEFVPSISGASTSIASISRQTVIIDALKAAKVNSAMLSIYDIARSNSLFANYYDKMLEDRTWIHNSLGLARSTILFIDSGGYEMQKLGVKLSDWDDAMRTFSHQIAIRGDVIVILDKPTFEAKSEIEKRRILEENVKSAKAVIKAQSLRLPLMAVAHGYDEESLISNVKELAGLNGLMFVGLSSKELGRIEEDKSIRILSKASRIIRSVDNLKRLHVLAAGDISLWPIYATIGVSTFDSTAWIDQVASKTGMHWWNLGDAVLKDHNCDCEFCLQHGKPLAEVSNNENDRLVHNLACIRMVMNRIRDAMNSGKLYELIKEVDSGLLQKLLTDKDMTHVYRNLGLK